MIRFRDWNEKKSIEKRISDLKRKVKRHNKVWGQCSKERGKMETMLRCLEEVTTKFEIDRIFCHRGKLEVVKIKKISQNIGIFFGVFQAEILNLISMTTNDEEAEEKIWFFVELGQFIDGALSLEHATRGNVNDKKNVTS